LAVNTASELEPRAELENIYGVVNQSTTIMTGPQRERALDLADVVIAPPLDEFSNLDFNMADSIIARGYTAACRTLDLLLAHQPALRQDDTTATERILLDSISITGLDNKIFEHREAEAFLRWSHPQQYSTVQLERRLQQIIDKGQMRRISTRLRVDSTGTFADITLEPYPLLREVHFKGNSVFTDSILEQKFSPQLGRPADAPQIAAAARECLELYEKQAYSLAEISAIELDDKTGRLTVSFDEGRLSGLEVTGNKSVKDWVVTRHFPLQRGRLFNYRVFLKGLEDLHATGLFSHVSGRVIKGEDGAKVILKVAEKDYDIIRFGLRHDLEYQTDVFVEIVNSNLLGLGNEIYLHAGYCPRRERYAVGLRADRIFRTYLTAAVQIYREIHYRDRYADNRHYGFFETARKGLLVSFGQNLKRFGAISGKFRSEDIVLTDGPPVPHSVARLRSAIFSLRYDDLDRLPFARRGRRADISMELANDFAGGNVIFRKASATLENWLSPNGRLTIGQRLTLGTADHVLPDYERFALGT
jgi:outer membrane protein assembly factor BamA